MSAFLFLSLLLLPLLNAERLQTGLENNDQLLMQRAIAANYLLGLPMRRYQHRLFGSPVDSSSLFGSSDSDDQSQQRGKRIYWENLAFHAADYNQKGKKV